MKSQIPPFDTPIPIRRKLGMRSGVSVGRLDVRTTMNVDFVALLACIVAFGAGLSAGAYWTSRKAPERPSHTAERHDDDPYPMWFE